MNTIYIFYLIDTPFEQSGAFSTTTKLHVFEVLLLSPWSSISNVYQSLVNVYLSRTSTNCYHDDNEQRWLAYASNKRVINLPFRERFKRCLTRGQGNSARQDETKWLWHARRCWLYICAISLLIGTVLGCQLRRHTQLPSFPPPPPPPPPYLQRTLCTSLNLWSN